MTVPRGLTMWRKIRRQLKPEPLSELAQHRLVLPDWVGKHKGSRKYVTIAGKC